MEVVQVKKVEMGASSDPRTKPRFVFMRCKRLGSGRLRAPPVRSRDLFLCCAERNVLGRFVNRPYRIVLDAH